MRDAARTLASYGRNGDDMLVHVSRKELEGIRALTGRDFTRNPDTGLPEAFNFASLLPIAAGIGASVLTGGAAAPLVGAAASGLTSAGVAAARGASTEQALTQGLISGATSYAGGQILAGVGDPVAQATQTATTGLGESALQGAGSSMAAAPTGTAAASIPGPTADVGSFGVVPAQAPFGGGAEVVQPPGLMDRMATRASDFGTRLSNIASDPGAAVSKIAENVQARPFSALIAGGGMLSQAGDMMGGRPAIPGVTPYDSNRYPEQFPTNPRRWNAPSSGYRAGTDSEYRYFAKGGLASMRSEEGYTANLMNEAKAAILGEHPRPREALERFRENFGDDALALLRDRLTGGRVRGAGGGMDDLVPGDIEGRQKVRLADGEFVIPADVVSGLGDGSTDQGVRKLHGLMDKVRKERTGKVAQPKSVGGKISL